MDTQLDIRPSPIAGKWYPSNPERLAQSVDSYLEAAQLPEIHGEIVAIIVPHAGHIYSGPVAGYAFAAIRGLTPEIVTVVSPMHHPYLKPLLTSAHQAYATPLGEIPIDIEARNTLDEFLREETGVGLSSVRNDPEHSLEIELPFLQRVLPTGFRLLPIMVRDQSEPITRGLGRALARTLKNHASLLVASTDLSHFYTQHIAEKLDGVILQEIEELNPAGILEAEEAGKGFACGKGALAAVMWAALALGATHSQILHYATSGDVSGDFSQVVGYAAAVLTR
jgi:AmmeMemoRadiSam system protein B